MKNKTSADKRNCDFSGWATRNNLRCSDGRTIMRNAFEANDGQTVPLVWNHRHDDPFNILGHALLENRDEGVYAYCTFNDTESGRNAKALVEHGDVSALSIYANCLKQDRALNVMHGKICEVSLVLAGANPGASIQSVLRHGEEMEDEADIFTGENICIYHSTESEKEEKGKEAPADDSAKKDEKPEKDKKDDGEETVADIFNTLSEKQKTVVYALIGQALEDRKSEEDTDDKTNKGGNDSMKHNIFSDAEEKNENNVLSHSEQAAIFADAKRCGSLKDAVLAHGIENIDYLYPDARTVADRPGFIMRDMSWVDVVMNGIKHTPFSRIKSVFADITEDEARAKGYIKGKLKKNEVFTLLKRSTEPTTIYKKQKLDRDDVIDITDLDVVAWMKTEMRMMLNEEIARAVLIGDRRETSDEDHIPEDHIRPIAFDSDLFTIKVNIPVAKNTGISNNAKDFIKAVIRARKDYKGSGSPTMFTTEDVLTECLLLEDGMGRALYDNEEALARKMRVSRIVTVPVMEGVKGANGGDLLAVIVNLSDYTSGADKGGAVNMFDDFDINYNAQLYLIETRCSGAMMKPHSAIAVEMTAAGSAVSDEQSA